MFRGVYGGVSPSDIDDAIAEGRFGDAMLLSWGFVEAFVDELTGLCLEFSGKDPRMNFAMKRSIGAKLRLLRDMDYLTIEEFDALWMFKDIRNEVFHEFIKGRHAVAKFHDKQFRDKTLLLARDAAHAAMYAFLTKLPSVRKNKTDLDRWESIRSKHKIAMREKGRYPPRVKR